MKKIIMVVFGILLLASCQNKEKNSEYAVDNLEVTNTSAPGKIELQKLKPIK